MALHLPMVTVAHASFSLNEHDMDHLEAYRDSVGGLHSHDTVPLLMYGDINRHNWLPSFSLPLQGVSPVTLIYKATYITA